MHQILRYTPYFLGLLHLRLKTGTNECFSIFFRYEHYLVHLSAVKTNDFGSCLGIFYTYLLSGSSPNTFGDLAKVGHDIREHNILPSWKN